MIPNWNHRGMLPRAVASALNAAEALAVEGLPAEVIVLDDASRDGSAKLVRTMIANRNDHYLRLIELPHNVGLPRNRNFGMEVAQFRYVCPLDADNELLAPAFPIFLEAMRSTGATLVYGNLVRRRGRNIVGLHSNDVATLRLTAGNYIDACSLIDADRLVALGGYTTDERLYGWEDWEFLLHLIAEEEPIVFVPAVFGFYFIHANSMIEETNRHVEERLALLRRIFAQTGPRDWDKKRVGRVYHPATGYLDEW